MTLSDAHRDYLLAHAISEETLERTNIRSQDEEIVFPWTDGDKVTEQRRPWPGQSGQYFWAEGEDLHFWCLRDAGPDSPVLLIEGTKQSLAGASWAPENYSVYGMAGCWGWVKEKPGRFKSRPLYVCLDADAATNLDVYEAGDKLAEKVKRFGTTVQFLRIPGTGSQGLDDYLATIDPEDRTTIIQYEIDNAGAKPCDKKPTSRKRKMEFDLPDIGGRVGVAVNLDRKEVIDKITGALKDEHDGRTLFNYGDVLTRVSGHETKPLDRDSFYALLVDTVACFKYSEATDKRPALFEPAWPDPPSIGAVMSKAGDYSPLRRVVRVPFVRADGTICTTPGYDRDTATVLVLGDLEVTPVPSEPTQAEVRQAAKYLMEDWLGDFPFPSDADRANAFATVLTPFLRGLVPLVPLAVFNGLEAGVGKNLLADCIHILATGVPAMPLPFVNNDEEMRKQLTSAFSSGAEFFIFDEAHTVEGAQMARALTSLTYGDRILGVSRIAKFPNQATWLSLGNQVQVNGDMSRRVYFVALRPVGTTLSDRDSRAYRHPDIKEWTTENRPQLVSAALTVLRGWFAAGRPSYSRGASLGSFEPWDRMLSGVLAYAGYPAFLTDVKERRSENDFTASYWDAHVSWLHGRFGTAEFTTREVQEQALRDPSGYEAPPGMEDPAGRSYTRVLGQAYSKHRDRNYSGIRLVKAGMGHKSTIRWQTIPDNGGEEGTGGNATTPPVTGEHVSDMTHDAHVSRVRAGAGGLPPVPSVPSSAPAPLTTGGNGPSLVDEVVQPATPVVLGFDIETASADEMFMGLHEGPFVRLVGTTSEGTTPTTDASLLIDALNCADVIYGHNILKFDLAALAHHHGADYDALAAKAVDTFVLSQLADPPGAKGMKPWGEKGHYGLDRVAQRLGHPGKSDDLAALAREFGGYDKIPADDARYRDYLMGDLAATRHVFETLPELNDYARREMRVAALQNRMMLNGFAVDKKLLAERVAAEDARRKAAVDVLHSDYGMPVRRPAKAKLKVKAEWPEGMSSLSITEARAVVKEQPEKAVASGIATLVEGDAIKSPWSTTLGRQAIIDAFAAAGAPFYPTTSTGIIKLSSEAMGDGMWYDADEGISKPGMLKAYPPEQYPEVAKIVALINQATGATAKYAEIQTWTTSAGRVHPEMGSVQASGRWSTVKPATANLDPAVRDVFVADPGHVILTVDGSQMDVRAVAGLSQDPALIEMLQPGRDYHRDMAEVMFGDRSDASRKRGKPISHGVNYGQGAKAIAERNGLDLGLVSAALAARAGTFPRLEEWKAEVRALGESGALLDNGFGRLMRCDPARAYTQAPALMGQGATRDLMTESMLRLVEAHPGVTQYLRGVVHDELIVSVPAAEAEAWAAALEDAFTWEWRGVPILCSVSNAGANWLECEH